MCRQLNKHEENPVGQEAVADGVAVPAVEGCSPGLSSSLHKTQTNKAGKPSATIWMDSEGITLSEVSQTENDEYCVFSLLCVIQKG